MSFDEPIQVLIVDDDETHAQTVAEILDSARDAYQCTVATTGEQGLRLIEEQTFDLIVTDLIMNGIGGLDVLAKAQRELPDSEVIILTGHGTIQTAVAAMQAGAFTYLTKPLDIGELRSVVKRASQSRRLAQTNLELQRQLNEKFGFEGVIGNSPQMNKVMTRLRQFAPTDVTVLITGENGTGKELAARALHYNSPRKDKPFVAVNCGALPENLVESQLFGHLKGAFTGADRETKGYFGQANGGTIFLDEVGEMPLATQVKLLRTLENSEITRVGAAEPIKVNVRVIAATNRDLEKAVNDGQFRQDLFQRLKGCQVKMPPLRERLDDIPLLFDQFLRETCQKYQKDPPSISAVVRRALNAYDWPGNIRELRNVVVNMVLLDADGILDADDLPDELQGLSLPHDLDGEGADQLVGKPLEEVEKHYIAAALKECQGNRAAAARMLGIGERTLYRKIREYQLD